ncbi:MAG: hypothetical protein ACK5JT_06565, partial [Hyphomicrobiaceae bacterium]
MAQPAHKLDDELSPDAPETAATETSATETNDRASPALDRESQIGKGKLDLASAFQIITRDYGRSYNQVLVEIARLSFGPGKLKVDEYLDLGLYSEGPLKSETGTFSGLGGMRGIWEPIN